MAPVYSASSSRQKETNRSDALPSETDAASDLVLVRPSRTVTWNSTSLENTGAVDSLPSNSIRISPQVVSRWTEHVMALNDEQRRLFLRSYPRDDVVTYTKAVEGIIDDKLNTSKVVRGTKWIEPLVSFLDICRPMVDALSGLYPPAGLILGGIFLVLSVTKRVVKYQEALVQFLVRVTSTLSQLNKFRNVFPDSTEIQTGLVDLFDIILQTCAQASALFFDKKGKEKSTTRLFWRSFEKDFGEWKQSLNVSLETFDRTVQLVSGQRLGDLHGGQMMAVRMQLETYREIRRNESKRLQEVRELEARQLQKEQEENRSKLLAWLSPLSFQKTHDRIVTTTLNDTGTWVLHHKNYTAWKKRPREALLWVYGKHGSGKSHLAARVIEELRGVCQERNAAADNMIGNDHGGTNSGPRISEAEGDPIRRSAEDESSLALWQEDIVPANSSDNNDGPSMTGAAAQRTAASEGQSSTNRTAVAYVYCSIQQVQGSERLRTGRSTEPADCYDSTGLLSCILKQLYQFLPRDMDVSELTHACFERCEDQPTREAIQNGIRSIIPMFSQSFIVIDGLDECSGMPGLEFDAFCDFLARLTSVSMEGPSASVVIFSRPGYQAITHAIDGCPRIEVDQGANSEDISRFIDKRSVHLTRDFASLKEIQGHLLNSADGMFLWVSLVIESIRQERTAKKMKAAARNMPRGLHGAYADALKRIIAAEPSIRELALKALLWTTNSKKPLSKAQLLEALAIEERMTSIGEDEKLDDDVPLAKDCADLLVFKDGQYMLLHPSLGDFLRGLCDDNSGGLEAYGDLQTNAAQILAVDCVTYLKFDAFTRGPMPTEAALKENFEQHPFLEYAAVFWGDHVREALDRDNPGNQSIKDSTYELLELRQRRDLLHQVHMRLSSRKDTKVSVFPFPGGTPLLHILSIFGLHHLLWRYRMTELDINETDGFGNCPLDYASQNGHKAMSSKIMEEHINRVNNVRNGIDRQCKSKSWLMGTIIHYHWTDLMIILLDLGHSNNPHKLRRTMTALHLASYCGHTDMMEKLLLSGADPDAQDHIGLTPLMVAVQSNHLEATKMLLEYGANASHHHNDGNTALHMVANSLSGSEEVAAALLDNGGNIDARSNAGHTPLYRASAYGSGSMVSFLLDRGANKELATYGSCHTPLLAASMCGRSDAVRILLSRGASIQAVSIPPSTALLEAAVKDSVETVAHILAVRRCRTVLNWKDKDGYTALSAAVSRGNISSAEKLLEEGADVNSATHTGMTPLLLALDNGYMSIARKLVEIYNADPHLFDQEGRTAMHISAGRDSAEAVQMLMSWGLEAFSRDHVDRTPLHIASFSNNAKVVEYYVKHFSAENVLQRQSSHLSLVCSNNSWLNISPFSDPKVVKCLVQWKPDLCLWHLANGDLPIHRAVVLGKIELVKLLFHPEVMSKPGANGNTPLHFAVRSNNSKMVHCLLEHGADVDGRRSNRSSPLIEALHEGYYEIANLLLDWKANVDVKDDGDRRPLHYVASKGHKQLTRRLMDAGCELEPLDCEGGTPLFFACLNNYPEIINLFLARGVKDIVHQRFRGQSYAHVAAYRGNQSLLENLLEMNINMINQLDGDGLDPLCVAAWSVEPDAAELLLACGASPDGPSYTQMTPLALAADAGSIKIVQLLLRAGAQVDKVGALLRTPLMWAACARRARIANHLLKAGANPFLRDELGLSAFDLALGSPAVSAILNPWRRPQRDISISDGPQVGLLLQFISRTARTTAQRIKQGANARVNRGDWPLQISSVYFFAFTDAVFSLIRTHEANLLLPERARATGSIGSCPHSRPGDSLAAVPVKRAAILSEYWSLFSDSDGEPTCGFCFADLELDYYLCSFCHSRSCADCQHAVSVLSLEERLQDFGRLTRLKHEVFAVLRALRPIRHQDARALATIISHVPCLRHWILQKNQDYRMWKSSRKVYSHFKVGSLAAWKAVETMKSILSLLSGPSVDAGGTDGRDTEQTDLARSAWNCVTEQWQDIFACNILAEDFKDVCGHQWQMHLKASQNMVDAALDSSGKLTAEFFDFLADKYKAAMNVGVDIMDFLESKQYGGERPDNVPAQGFVREPTAGQGSIQPEEPAGEGGDTESVVSSLYRSSSDDSSSDRSSSEFSGLTWRKPLETGNTIGIDLEDVLDSLLVKRNSLAKDGRLTEEEDLILNTAWNVAQAIVYQGTPRPSLKGISDNAGGYYTASTTPLPSDGGVHGENADSSYGTPRSMSPASWVLDLDE